jgi:hypothetical protein
VATQPWDTVAAAEGAKAAFLINQDLLATDGLG